MKNHRKGVRRRALAAAILAGVLSSPAMADHPVTNSLVETAVVDLQVTELSDDQVLNEGQVAQVAADEPVASGEPINAPVPLVNGPRPIYETPPSSLPPAIDYGSMAGASSGNCNCEATKKKKEAATAAMKAAYAGVFYANNFSYLNDRFYDGPSFAGDPLKGLMGGKLDIGGEARVRYHSENGHRGLGLTGRDDEFFLQRYRLFANLRVNEYFRIFGEYLYADSGGEIFNNRPIEENRGEIQNLFLDTNLTESLMVRVGRQELLFGAQRLISPLDWANTRRTFQGARGTYKGDGWALDGFFVNPVNRNAANESKIDDANENVDFYGVYLARTGTQFGNVDNYYLGLNNQLLNFDYHTIGSRWYGATEGGVLYEFEGGTQFGTNSNGSNHSANFFTGGLGRKLSICLGGKEWTPTLWGWYDWASGEENFANVARGDDSFDHLFPLAHKYNGFMDLFGRRNLHDVNFQFITPIGPRVTMITWFHHFFLDQATTPYGVTMAPFNTVAAAGDKELGQELDLLFNININPRNNVLVGWSHFAAGDYYDTTAGVPSNADADFFYCQYQMRF